MLDTSIDEIMYDDSGKVVGVRSGDNVATCKKIVGAPEYFPEKVSSVGKVGLTWTLYRSFCSFLSQVSFSARQYDSPFWLCSAVMIPLLKKQQHCFLNSGGPRVRLLGVIVS